MSELPNAGKKTAGPTGKANTPRVMEVSGKMMAPTRHAPNTTPAAIDTFLPAPMTTTEKAEIIVLLKEINESIKALPGLLGNRTASTAHKAPAAKRAPVCCIFCSGTHKAIDCDQYKSPQSRWAVIGEKSLCRFCGTGGHDPQRCHKRDRICLYCDRKHLSALCDLEPHARKVHKPANISAAEEIPVDQIL
ncbi:Protein CBG19522 [Caenorhabditis briggsae]|uniref:Protein CBG19522 n=1 Tax=Caenorhabditis briggsae TaxID=6238 RepID=A8XVT5_CAEBR|nr:Protein CBG19522 [Caenorhabditis briggsae]CAP36754.2 Protein CBG19522 [Caenorhabditis briggsae]